MSNTVLRRSTHASAVIGGGAGAIVLVDWAASTALTAWASVRSTEAPERLVEQTVLLVSAATLAITVLWLSMSVLVCTADALRAAGGSDDRGTDGRVGTGRTGVLRPRLAQAVVAAALGGVVTAGGAAVAVRADGGDDDVGRLALPQALDGLALPDRAYGGVRTHLVGPGESLWSITADYLPRGGCADVVHRRWPRLHQLNRDRIGGDPHLIRPGTNLRLPTWRDAPNRGATR